MESIDAFKLTDSLHAEQGRGDPFAAAVRATRMPMIITDPRQGDNPIVFTNDAFSTLTGYRREEVLGRNCRFLQGRDTDPADIDELRDAVATQRDASVEILNYRKDGTTFWNALYMSPVFSEGGELQFFFASQFDVTDRKEREIAALESKAFFEQAVHERTAELEAALEQKTVLLHEVDHRVKNNLQMVAAMISNQARFSDDPGLKTALHKMRSRVETLGSVHRRIYESKDITTFHADEFIREIATDLIGAAGRPGVELKLELEALDVGTHTASPLALLVNELITNALKHAFPDERPDGTITVRTTTGADGMAQISVEDDGIGISETPEKPRTFGHRLIDFLVRQMRGTIDWGDALPGSNVTVRFPTERRAGST